MFARASTVEGTRDRLEDGIAMLEHAVMDELQHIEGFSGIIALADRETGRNLVITLWETEDAMRSSEEQANRLRKGAADALGASATPQVERYEVVLQEMRTPVHA